MALTDQLDVASMPSFQNKVLQASLATAINVIGESTGTTNHIRRAQFANKVIVNPDGYQRAIAMAVASDGTTTNASTDANIQTRVANIWNALAGTD